MTPGDLERLVGDGYDRVAGAYARLEGEAPWPRGRWVEELLARLPEPSRVLDLGCGSGIPVLRALVERGHAALGVDVSAEQIARARANVPEAELRCGSFLELDVAPATFDAAVSLYAIEHVPRETHARLLETIRRALRAGGWLLLTVETGDEPGVVGDWLGAPMYISHFDAATSEQLVRDAGFEIVAARTETQLEGGRPVEYLWVLAQAA
jgi:SAM-dependent methyltransferase